MSHSQIQDLLVECECALVECRDNINDQKALNLEKFQGIISDLCQHIAALPRDEAIAYQDHLQALTEALSALETIMRQQKDLTQQELEKLQGRKVAHLAYKTHSHSPQES